VRIGALRHRVTLQSEVTQRDPATGAAFNAWSDFATGVPAEVVPLSGREFIAAGARQAEVAARATIRYQPGVLPTMRVLFDGATYEIVAVLPDPTGRGHLTLMLATGVNDG
jgi:SPP1 family predicted phage head-tail adaptor